MVVAKNDRAHRALAAQFADHGSSGEPFERSYLAFVWGAPERPHGIDRQADRPPPARPRPHGGARRRPRGGHPLAGAGALCAARRRPGAAGQAWEAGKAASAAGGEPRSPAGSKPAGPTRFGSIWPRLAIRSWATRSMAAGFPHQNRPFAARSPGRAGCPWQTGPPCPYFGGQTPHRAAKSFAFRSELPPDLARLHDCPGRPSRRPGDKRRG